MLESFNSMLSTWGSLEWTTHFFIFMVFWWTLLFIAHSPVTVIDGEDEDNE